MDSFVETQGRGYSDRPYEVLPGSAPRDARVRSDPGRTSTRSCSARVHRARGTVQAHETTLELDEATSALNSDHCWPISSDPHSADSGVRPPPSASRRLFVKRI